MVFKCAKTQVCAEPGVIETKSRIKVVKVLDGIESYEYEESINGECNDIGKWENLLCSHAHATEDKVIHLFIQRFMGILADKRGMNTTVEDEVSYCSTKYPTQQPGPGLYEEEWSGSESAKNEYGQVTGTESSRSFPSVSKAECDMLLCRGLEEDVELLISGARYSGHVSHGLLQGPGCYTWPDGSSVQGQFVDGLACGAAKLEFPNKNKYEGGLWKGFRHGEGLQCMYGSPAMYSGQWWLGRKHGFGLMVYEDSTKAISSYLGDWQDDVHEGFGERVYPSGAKYIGYWKNGRQHGQGIMAWTNNDVYDGDWENGLMHGYGVYTWRPSCIDCAAFCTFNTYRGQWKFGARDGSGALDLLNGSIVKTTWMRNSKEGRAVVIGCNGRLVGGDFFFVKDKPCGLNKEGLAQSEDVLRTWVRGVQKAHPKSLDDEAETCKRSKCLEYLQEIPKLPVQAPVHTIDLNPHLAKMTSLISSGQPPDYTAERESLRCALERNMSAIKTCYYKYANTVCAKHGSHGNAVLTRYSLWHMLRDTKLNLRNHSLADMDLILADEEHLLLTSAHDPFEKLLPWQFLHVLLSLSWLFYGQFLYLRRATEPDEAAVSFVRQFRNRGLPKAALGPTLQYFLDNDLLNNNRRDSDRCLMNCKDVKPMREMYVTFQQLGEPLTAQTLLKEICSNKVTCSDLPDRLMSHTEVSCCTLNTYTHANILQAYRLAMLGKLSAKEVVHIMAEVCPLFMRDLDVVLIDYKLCFLECWEVIVGCAREVIEKMTKQPLKFNNEIPRTTYTTSPQTLLKKQNIKGHKRHLSLKKRKTNNKI